MSAPLNGAELLARIRPVPREESTQICMRPDLIDAFHAAEARLAESRVKDAASERLSRSGPSARTKKLAQEVADLEKQIEASSIWFRFRAMNKDEWAALCDNNPPRKGNQLDSFVGFNRDVVNDAAVRMCLFDPVFEDCDTKGCEHDDCGSWQAMVKVLNPSEWKELRETTTYVNDKVVDLPKSALASQILSKRGSASRQPAAGE